MLHLINFRQGELPWFLACMGFGIHGVTVAHGCTVSRRERRYLEYPRVGSAECGGDCRIHVTPLSCLQYGRTADDSLTSTLCAKFELLYSAQA